MTQQAGVPPTKEARREAGKLIEAARSAFAGGDYRLARTLHERIVKLVPEADMAAESRSALATSLVDPWAVRLGLAATALYVMAWAVALS